IARRVPVIWADASRARTAIASATASTGTQPFRSLSGIAARFAGVSMVLGRTAFTVIPLGRVSWASAWVRAITPALATVWAMKPPAGGTTAREATMTTRPYRARTMAGTTAFATLNAL